MTHTWNRRNTYNYHRCGRLSNCVTLIVHGEECKLGFNTGVTCWSGQLGGLQVVHTFRVTSGKVVSLVHCWCMGGEICVGPKDDNWPNGHW